MSIRVCTLHNCACDRSPLVLSPKLLDIGGKCEVVKFLKRRVLLKVAKVYWLGREISLQKSNINVKSLG